MSSRSLFFHSSLNSTSSTMARGRKPVTRYGVFGYGVSRNLGGRARTSRLANLTSQSYEKLYEEAPEEERDECDSHVRFFSFPLLRAGDPRGRLRFLQQSYSGFVRTSSTGRGTRSTWYTLSSLFLARG